MTEIIEIIIVAMLLIIVSSIFIGATIIFLKLIWLTFKETWDNLI